MSPDQNLNCWQLNFEEFVAVMDHFHILPRLLANVIEHARVDEAQIAIIHDNLMMIEPSCVESWAFLEAPCPKIKT